MLDTAEDGSTFFTNSSEPPPPGTVIVLDAPVPDAVTPAPTKSRVVAAVDNALPSSCTVNHPLEMPVNADPSPVYAVAAHVPVILTPVDVVANFAEAECFKVTDESEASDIASSVLCLDCISSTFIVDILKK